MPQIPKKKEKHGEVQIELTLRPPPPMWSADRLASSTRLLLLHPSFPFLLFFAFPFVSLFAKSRLLRRKLTRKNSKSTCQLPTAGLSLSMSCSIQTPTSQSADISIYVDTGLHEVRNPPSRVLSCVWPPCHGRRSDSRGRHGACVCSSSLLADTLFGLEVRNPKIFDLFKQTK